MERPLRYRNEMPAEDLRLWQRAALMSSLNITVLPKASAIGRASVCVHLCPHCFRASGRASECASSSGRESVGVSACRRVFARGACTVSVSTRTRWPCLCVRASVCVSARVSSCVCARACIVGGARAHRVGVSWCLCALVCVCVSSSACACSSVCV